MELNSAEIEDDPVVKEIPVFLSKTLADKLFILQYPAHNKNVWANINVAKTFIKPENQKIRVELAMDTTNELSYDPKTGERLSLNTDEKSTGNDGENIFDSGLMDKVVLTSERALLDSHLAVGIFQDDELHITPLKTVLHMKLQHNYLDESEKHGKDGTKGMGEDDNEEEDNATPVNVTFARRLPDNLKKLQEQSFQHYSKKSDEEPWICTNYYSSNNSDDTQIEVLSTRMAMFCPSTEESVNLNLTQKNYLDQLVPQSPDKCYLQASLEKQISLHYIKTLPLKNRIKTVMQKVRVISFANLCKILLLELNETTMREVLKYLQDVAMLVQGNWVVKSEEIYKDSSEDSPKDGLSPQNGVSDFMCKARDYILSSFTNTEQQYLNRSTILSVIKLTSNEINQIFMELLTFEPEKGWRLKEPFDSNFCNSHRDIVERQKILWKAKREHLLETMEAQNQSLQRQRRKSNRESLSSENEEKNVGRGRKSIKESSPLDNNGTIIEQAKQNYRSRKISETTT
ncbi:DNA-directed RNA polymerase III subunit RPC5 [Solenopsis invicta]|uniref:DNA-directed RNA polymerase III subunit RPC5 n=1 Tax=Solenopsis invicta TaxID=13686 RepID=UPI000595A9E3|nr:DNA-directed RNA polymerase III subunit RPC5 [Solenopsis invicta]XP_039312684.1 DNA-directed RNA polymerase III subunit RPC5 [Solenopsis invicta]